MQESESETVGPRVYVHYVNLDKRNDEWVPRSSLQPIVSSSMAPSSSTPSSSTFVPLNPKKRKRPSSRNQSASLQSDHEEEQQQQQQPRPRQQQQQPQEEEEEELLEFIGQTMVEQVTMTEEEYDLQRHKQLNTRRNFDLVYIGDWLIKTWYVPFTRTTKHLTRATYTGTFRPTHSQKAKTWKPSRLPKGLTSLSIEYRE